MLYPDDFNYAAVACPDPIGFTSYATVNLFEDRNAYYYDAPFKRTPRPGYRDHYSGTTTKNGKPAYGRFEVEDVPLSTITTTSSSTTASSTAHHHLLLHQFLAFLPPASRPPVWRHHRHHRRDEPAGDGARQQEPLLRPVGHLGGGGACSPRPLHPPSAASPAAAAPSVWPQGGRRLPGAHLVQGPGRRLRVRRH